LILLDNLPEILKLDKFNYEKEKKFFKSVVYEYNLVNDSILNGLLRLSGFYLISYIIYYVVKNYYGLFDFKDKYDNNKYYDAKFQLINSQTRQVISETNLGEKSGKELNEWHKKDLEKWFWIMEFFLNMGFFFITILFSFDEYACYPYITGYLIVFVVLFGGASFLAHMLFEIPQVRNLFIMKSMFYLIYYGSYYLFFKHGQNVKFYNHFKKTMRDKNLDIIYTKYKTTLYTNEITLEGNFTDDEEKYKEACGEAYRTFSY
jgi:hypothetical protein